MKEPGNEHLRAGGAGHRMRLPGRSLPEVFEARARANPHRVAVSAVDGDLAYGELDRRAGRLARLLIRYGVGPDARVALYVDATTDLVVGLLGILKAGGAYLPIDPALPGERVRLLIGDSAVSTVVTVSRMAARLSDCACRLVLADELPNEIPAAGPVARAPKEADLAYVIYTSGSTGAPKGVLIEHRNVIRLFEQTHHWFGFDEHDVWTVFHSIGFDFSVWEIWGGLLYGGRVVIVPGDVARSPIRFRALIAEHEVTVLSQTPTAFRLLLRTAGMARIDEELRSLRLIILGGERLDVEMLAPWFARSGDEKPRIVNMYGITETTVHASFRWIRDADLARPEVSPIGVPLPDLEFLVLDEAGRPVPDGEPGELYVGGAGLARGYLGREALTAERFLMHPAAGGRRVYRTGDRVVRLGAGEHAYLGRTDRQLKVRGYRIEPREIELVLNLHPEVAASAVVPHDYGHGDVRLVAYLLPRSGAIAAGPAWSRRVQAGLAGRLAELPSYLRPSAYVAAAALPMTINGKLDLDTLDAAASNGHPAGRGAYQAAGFPAIQSEITGIWCEVLGVSAVDRYEDFFDIGGTSLTVIRMLDRVNARFDTDLDIGVLVDSATVTSLAELVDSAVSRH